MKVTIVNEESEKAFWDHINEDPINHYFFIFDWMKNRDKTRVLLATEEGKIEGLMLVYDSYIVQLRGNRLAVKVLLDNLNLDRVELQAPMECEDLVLAKYAPKVKHKMDVMSLKKGEENIMISTNPERPTIADTDEIAQLMREGDPEWWGDVTAERIKTKMETSLWLVIRQDNRVASAGMARPTEFGSNIGIIATKEGYRNRGYATSIVSALVREILKVSPTALIHVLSDNSPAIRAYSKVGYRRHATYLALKT